MRLSLLAFFASALSLVCACSGSDDPDPAALTDAGVGVQTTPDATAAVAECREGESRTCVCDTQVGQQGCFAGKWAACYCAPPVRETGSELDCRPGTYTGNFLGFAGTPIPFVPVTGLSLDGKPPLVLELAKDSSLEFALVGSGTLSGSANGLFNFEATIKGTLDCNTKKFKGRLQGSAKDVFGLFINQTFDGDMTADYDTSLHQFVDGKWDLMSRDANAPDAGAGAAPMEIGGSGDWDGKLSPAAGADGGP